MIEGDSRKSCPLFLFDCFFLLELDQVGGLTIQKPTEGFKVFP
jgi:hypothetical protein